MRLKVGWGWDEREGSGTGNVEKPVKFTFYPASTYDNLFFLADMTKATATTTKTTASTITTTKRSTGMVKEGLSWSYCNGVGGWWKRQKVRNMVQGLSEGRTGRGKMMYD